jgi:hypothetical protein
MHPSRVSRKRERDAGVGEIASSPGRFEADSLVSVAAQQKKIVGRIDNDRRLIHTHTLEGMQVMGLASDPSAGGTTLAVCDFVSKAVHVLPWPLPGMPRACADVAGNTRLPLSPPPPMAFLSGFCGGGGGGGGAKRPPVPPHPSSTLLLPLLPPTHPCARVHECLALLILILCGAGVVSDRRGGPSRMHL